MSFVSKFYQVITSPRILVMLLLGVISGMPLPLVAGTFKIWLTDNNIPIEVMGYATVLMMPYTFKFLWSPLVDFIRIPILTKYMGQRRSWLVTINCCVALFILGMGYSHPELSVTNTFIVGFILAFFAATYDIVVDAFRIEYLTQDEQALGVPNFVLGYRIGMMLTGAGALFLADSYNWQLVYSMFAMISLLGIVVVIFVKEPENYKLKDHKGNVILDAVIEPFKDILKRPEWLNLVLIIVLFKMGEAVLGSMTSVFLVETGFTKSEIASVSKLFGFIATITGIYFAGFFHLKLGTVRALLICGILQMLSNLIFCLQNYVGHDLNILILTIFTEEFTGGLGTGMLVIFLSELCNKRYSATQYALLSAMASFARGFFASFSGHFVAYLGWNYFFIFTTIISLPALIFIILLDKRIYVTSLMKTIFCRKCT